MVTECVNVHRISIFMQGTVCSHTRNFSNICIIEQGFLIQRSLNRDVFICIHKHAQRLTHTWNNRRFDSHAHTHIHTHNTLWATCMTAQALPLYLQRAHYTCMQTAIVNILWSTQRNAHAWLHTPSSTSAQKVYGWNNAFQTPSNIDTHSVTAQCCTRSAAASLTLNHILPPLWV